MSDSCVIPCYIMKNYFSHTILKKVNNLKPYAYLRLRLYGIDHAERCNSKIFICIYTTFLVRPVVYVLTVCGIDSCYTVL